MDLLKPLYGAHLDLPDESAVEQFICFLLVLLIQGGYQILHPFGKHLTLPAWDQGNDGIQAGFIDHIS